MTSKYQPDRDGELTFSLGARARPGLAALLHAALYARDAGVDVWDFALEIDELYELGLRVSDLRWLVAKGFAGHGNEISVYGDPHRSFEGSEGLNFEPRTCLVLTEDGEAFVAAFLKGIQDAESAGNN